jgi:multidrug efflux pump subunit AcrA (membrane-fusion protein)
MIRPHLTRAIVLLLATVTMPSCTSHSEEEVESETVVPVQTIAASRGTIRAVIHATGEVVPAPGAELIVVAPEVARIAEVPHADGDRVRKGDVLVRFETPHLTADVQRQQAELTRAQAALQTATSGAGAVANSSSIEAWPHARTWRKPRATWRRPRPPWRRRERRSPRPNRSPDGLSSARRSME